MQAIGKISSAVAGEAGIPITKGHGAGTRSRVSHRLWHLGSPFQWAAIDAMLAFACMLVGFHTSPSAGNVSQIGTHLRPYYSASAFACIAFLSSYALGLSHYPNLRSQFRIVVLTLVLTMVISAGMLLATWVIFYKQIGRYILGIAGVLFFASDTSLRLLWFRLMSAAKHKVVIWSDSRFGGLFRKLLDRATFPIEIVYSGAPEACNLERLGDVIHGGGAHEIVVHGFDAGSTEALLEALNRGIAVSTMESFAERHFFKIPVLFIGPKWFFSIDLRQHHPFYDSAKRVNDVILAVVGAVLSAPLLFLGALLVKLTSRGPVFYSQMRVGVMGRPFRIWKLRTMHLGAEANGAQWAKLEDARVTFVGKFLRKTRIDEIPQFWNIIKGDMAFVGPRPERPEFVEILAERIPYYRQRHLIKPGLTGWAQICYPYGASEEDAREKLSYDLYYLKNVSFLLDLQIVLQTIGAIAKGSR